MSDGFFDVPAGFRDAVERSCVCKATGDRYLVWVRLEEPGCYGGELRFSVDGRGWFARYAAGAVAVPGSESHRGDSPREAREEGTNDVR